MTGTFFEAIQTTLENVLIDLKPSPTPSIFFSDKDANQVQFTLFQQETALHVQQIVVYQRQNMVLACNIILQIAADFTQFAFIYCKNE